jgi:SET domain-containing protein
MTRDDRKPGATRSFREVSGLPHGKGLVATRTIPRGAVVASFKGARTRAVPTYQSVQIGPHTHVDDPACLNLLNHSCDPTVRIHVGRRAVVAHRRIRKGEALTFFYPSTEWRMARPFVCRCGAPGGLAEVRGARDLPLAVLRRFPLSSHIRRMKEAQARARAGPARRRARHRIRESAA